MNSELETKTGQTVSGTATNSVPQHILDYCDRVYPPTLGSAYDGHRTHLIARRMEIERELAPKNSTASDPAPIAAVQQAAEITPAPSIPATSTSQDKSATNSEQISNQTATNAPQNHHESATNTRQNPPQNAEPSADQPGASNRKFKRRGPDSVIDSLTPETQEAIASLLEEHSADRVCFILSKPGPHWPAMQINRDVLYRYQRRLRREQSLTRAAEIKTFVANLRASEHAPEGEFSEAIRHIFQTRLLDEVSDPTKSLNDLLKALQTSERFRHNALAEKRVALSKTTTADQNK